MRWLLALLLLPAVGWAFSPARSPACDVDKNSAECKKMQEENIRGLAHWNCMNELASDKMDAPEVNACAEERLKTLLPDEKKAEPEDKEEKPYWK